MSQNEEKKEMPGLAEQGRYDICQACPSFEHGRKRCRECGCFMMNKTALRAAKCPLKKW